MTTFLTLPVELQFLIISEIELDDIEDFSLCCRALHQCSQQRLMEQYARTRHFSTIAIGHVDSQTWDEDEQVRGVDPLLILRDVLADPQSRFYTKTLAVGTMGDYDPERFGGDPEIFGHQEEGEADEVEVRDALLQLKHLSKEMLEVQGFLYPRPAAEKRIENILSGDSEAAAALLISILPNLEKLRLVDPFQRMWRSTFLETVEVLVHTAVVDKRYSWGINSFNRLKEVGMIGLDEDRSADYMNLQSFIPIPSLRSIKGIIMSGQYGLPIQRQSNSSNVTSLEFRHSMIWAKSIIGTLSEIQGLRRFIYDFWAGTCYDDQQWEPRQIVEALKAFTRRTLRHLELTSLTRSESLTGNLEYIDFKKGEPFIGSLKAFENLQTIRVETMMLYREIELPNIRTEEERKAIWARGSSGLVIPARLIQILPVTTHRLRLVGGLPNEDAIAMLEDLPALRHNRLPALSSIFFEDVERSEIDETMTKECEDAGVKMKFWVPSS